MDVVVQRIIGAMKSKGYDQKTLAIKINVRPQTITEWKKGITKSYTRYIPELSELLGVSADYLLNGAEAGPAGDPELVAFMEEIRPLSPEKRALVQGFIQGLKAQSE